MKVFITKYALTQGIFSVNAERCSATMITYKIEGRWATQYAHKPYWHTSLAEAVAHAEDMRVKRISSVEKQLEKLHRLSFSV